MLVASLFSFTPSSAAFFSRATPTNIGQVFLRRYYSLEMVDIKLESPSAERNKEPIWNVLDNRVIKRLLKNTEAQQQPPLRILEIAGGAGGACT